MKPRFASAMMFIAGLSVPAAAWAQANNSSEAGIGIIAWLLVGLVAGWLASLMVNRSGEGVILDIVLGIIGAFIGGIIFRTLGAHGVTGFNLWSIFVAFVGAVVLLALYHAVSGRRSRA